MSEVNKKKIKYVTLIWERLPESISIFIIPRKAISKNDLKILKACHLNYINSASAYTDLIKDRSFIEESLLTLCDYVSNTDLIDDEYLELLTKDRGIGKKELEKRFGKWAKYEKNDDQPFILPRSKFYRSGIFL